jgi:hypothetical protein
VRSLPPVVPEPDRRGGGNKAPIYIRAKARGGDDGRRVDWLGLASSRPEEPPAPLGGQGGIKSKGLRGAATTSNGYI